MAVQARDEILEKILGMKMSELPGFSFKCSCGRTHTTKMDAIAIGPGMDGEVLRVLEKYKGKRIFMLNDLNTRKVLGERIKRLLQDNGHEDIVEYTYKTEGTLHSDEQALGRMLIEAEKDTAIFVTVGSGTLNDITRIISYKMDIPYMIIATAPSMDGYTSRSSPIYIDGMKITIYAWQPSVVIADTEVLREAPLVMIRAGIGDIIGKYTALQDWKLSAIKTGEYHCTLVDALVRNAVWKCVSDIDKLVSRDEKVIGYAAEGLVLAGLTMGYANSTRPASGSEHLLAHYWEDAAVANEAKGMEHHLHGIYVGAATYVISLIFEMLAKELADAGVGKSGETELEIISSDEVKRMLDAAGCPFNPKDLSISREMFRESILMANVVRVKYTILQFAAEIGKLEGIADKLADMLY